jgi:hypothetical protein
MTAEKSKNILATVDDLLAGAELQPQSRAMLLLRLCQFSIGFAPDRLEHYWQLLQPLQKNLPNEVQPELTTLRTSLEESLPAGTKGFTAEMLALVHEARQETDPQVIKQRLLDCETKLKKHFLPFGKGPVWAALVDVWLPLDRPTAINLLKNVSGDLQGNYISRMNQAKPLSSVEWDLVISAVGKGKTVQVVEKILTDDRQSLDLSSQVLTQAAAALRSSMVQSVTAGNQVEMAGKFKNYIRLLILHAKGSQAALIPALLEELYLHVAIGFWLDQQWLVRFDLIESIFSYGQSLKSAGLEVFTPAFLDRLVAKTPAHILNYLFAVWAGSLTEIGQVDTAYVDLLARTKNDPNAEAWFLVALVKRGMGPKAMVLAEKSPNALVLIPRLRRSWICSHPESIGKVISPADMAGDPIGEFLAQGSAEKRAAYLKSITREGAISIPGAMWAGAGTEDQAEGVRGFWSLLTASKKTSDQIVQEYVQLNALYSSYRRDTRKEDQFSETLRINGFGNYRYQDLDNAMLAALVVWGDKDPQKVKTVLQAMWNAIRPDDPILMVDWLRNAIMTRCVNIFSADLNVLNQDYLAWLKKELVDKGRQWQFGKTTITLRYPNTALLQFSVIAASTISGVSPQRRDQILLYGLEKYEANPALVESAAQLYNSGKELLDLKPPLALKPDLLSAWQDGIIKNALLPIIEALILSAAEKAQKKS